MQRTSTQQTCTVLILLVLLSLPGIVQAGQWSIEGGIGTAFHRPTVDDGTWRQDHVQEPNFRLFDESWSVGLAYRINQDWSVQGHRFDWGEAAVKSRFASDEDYYGGHCPACPTASYKVVDRMHGYDLTLSRYFKIDETTEWYVKVGGAVAFHELKWTGSNSPDYGPTRIHGAIPMLAVGGGISYGPFSIETVLYQGTWSMNGGCIGGGEYECGYPLSKRVVVAQVLYKVFTWGGR